MHQSQKEYYYSAAKTPTTYLPDAGPGEEAARPGGLAGVVLLARVRGEALPEPQGLVGAASDLENKHIREAIGWTVNNNIAL